MAETDLLKTLIRDAIIILEFRKQTSTWFV
jgi:hypothetical protein